MKMFVSISLALLIIAVVIIISGFVASQRKPKYHIIMVNRTHRDLEHVGVYYDNQMAASAGSLVSGGFASYAFVTLPVTEEAVVTWKHPGGPLQRPKVKTSGIVPTRPRQMEVWFIIEEDGSVTVESVRREDRETHHKLRDTLDPYRKKA